MQIFFLGTRGYIEAKNRRHRKYTSTLVVHKKTRIMIDCGIGWERSIPEIQPTAIIITHAHPDHAFGLQYGAPCPVYATKESWQLMASFPITAKYVIKPNKRFVIDHFLIEPFFVVHSLIAPAIGYRITVGKKTIFCAHDLISVPKRQRALRNAILYIGDGASITRPIIRRKNNKLFGHTTVRAQIGWCGKEKVPYAIFTHCGSQIVKGDERTLGALVRKIGKKHTVNALIAYDGMQVRI